MNIRLISALALTIATIGAQAAQTTRSACSVDGSGGGNVVSAHPEDGWLAVPGMSKVLNNTTGAAKQAYITFSADAGVEADAELRLAFSIDGGSPFYAGPQNLANTQQYWASRSTVAVLSIPPGSHTIQPMWHVNGVNGKLGILDDRCMIVTF
jgi:hypothetical protein